MENKNQNEESKRSGMELLENVVKSNDNNIASNLENKESNAELKADIEYLVLAIGQMQLDDYSEQSTPLIPTQSTPVNFIKNFLDFPLDSY